MCGRSYIPRASKHLPRELALSGSWSRHMAPTCTSGPRRDYNANGLGGNRCIGGMSFGQALKWNVGTWTGWEVAVRHPGTGTEQLVVVRKQL